MQRGKNDWFVDANNRFTLYCGCVYRNTIVSTRRREFAANFALFAVIHPQFLKFFATKNLQPYLLCPK